MGFIFSVRERCWVGGQVKTDAENGGGRVPPMGDCRNDGGRTSARVGWVGGGGGGKV